MKFRTRKPDADWLDRSRANGWTRDSKLETNPSVDPKFFEVGEQLKEKLLALGGHIVAYWGDEDDAMVVAKGEPLDGALFRGLRMEQRECHHNAVALGEQGGEVWTGWALSSDGCWRAHSWARLKGVFVETTEPRVAYFGTKVPPSVYNRW
jgi:hypothetical protein